MRYLVSSQYGHVGAELAGLDAQRLGDRMLEPRFRRRGEPEQMPIGDAAFVADHVEHRRRAVGQRAGLVEDHGVDLGEALHMGAALDDDAGARRMRHRGEHGGRRGDADAGAVIDDHERQETVEIAGQRRRADRQAECRHDQPVGELLGVVLHPRIADRRGFDQLRDLPGGGEIADADGADRQLAVADDGRGEHGFAFRPHDRQALAGDGLLVDHGVAVDDLAVDRNDLARIDDDLVADHQLGGRYRGNDAVANHPGRSWPGIPAAR